ncbi:MAG: Rieske (2Fe-2S) protein [Planctomycetes bacterium]|nr:Rieske (2Fe-2S) protein [Planctomycetota bacterium]
MSTFHTICQTDEIPEDEARMFVIDNVMVGVFHVNGEYFALDNRCPHAGASLAGGIIENDTIRCRIHHWRFCVREGTYLDEDKPRFNARTFAVRVVGAELQVEI